MHRSLLLAAAATAATSVLAAPALAQAPTPAAATTIAFKELDKGSTFHFIDVAPKSPRRNGFPTRVSAGDQFVFTNPLVDDAGKRVGTLRAHCIAPAATKRFDFDCTGLFHLAAGDIWALATTGSGNTTTGAIIGGTGMYAGARGVFVSTETKSGSDDTLTLLP